MWLLVLALGFCLLGIFGGMCAVSRWVRGYSAYFVLERFGAALYLAGLLITGPAFLLYAAGHSQELVSLFLIILLPFGLLGHVLWVFAVMLEMGARALGPSDLPTEKTFDKGDAFMSRGLFVEAERQYRADLAEVPHNCNALFRVCRALEARGQTGGIARELWTAYRASLDKRGNPPLPRKEWQERILRITFALGDVLDVKLNKPGQARHVYAESLEILYGYPDADPLRDRLRKLDARLKNSGFEEKPEPLERLPLDD
jgi:hypothetical protein